MTEGATLTTRVTALEQHMDEHDSLQERLELKIDLLKADSAGLASEVRVFRAEVSGFRIDVAGLRSDVAKMRPNVDEIPQLKDDVGELKIDMAEVRKKVERIPQLQKDMGEVKAAIEPIPAMHAGQIEMRDMLVKLLARTEGVGEQKK